MRRRVVPLVILIVLAVAAPLAWTASSPGARSSAERAQKPPKLPRAVRHSADLWATINVCDTLAHPDTIGIRGSMPGLRVRTTVWMRFRVQYLATQGDGRWHDVADHGDSGWKRLARLRRRVVEAGQNFTFQPPAAGGAHRLRGVVLFRWTRHGETLGRLRRVTEAGHRSTAGADPDGYSAAVCDIT